MKNNTVKGILTATLIVAGSVSSFAQSPDLARRRVINDSVTNVFAQKYAEKKQELTVFANANGVPMDYVKDGKPSHLVDVMPDGTPVYITTSNAGSAITSRVNLLYPGGSAGLSLTGNGVYAGIWDGGPVLTTHITFGTSRSRARNVGSGGTDIAHPSHVAGTMVGSGGSTPAAKGMAYEATIGAYYWDNDIQNMSSAASPGLMVVSNHSYGLNSESHAAGLIPLYGKYVSQSVSVDQLMRNNPTYQVVVAAGNDRTDSAINPSKSGNDLLSQFATAKNTLVVAAVAETLNYTGPSSVSVASFSSYGPTDDFRIKPDIAAKGVNVYSSINTGDTKFGTLSGTSMASPGISGVVILLQQHYSNLHSGSYMWSSSVRALLAHTADEIGSAQGPDHMTGYGLVNAAKAASVMSKQSAGSNEVVFEQKTLTQGGTYSFDVDSNGTTPLVATIAWTDVQGVAAPSSAIDSDTPVIVNDLDIKIVDNANSDNIYYPWRLRNNFSNPVALRNATNNVDNIEKVEVDAPKGSYKVIVSHKKATLSGGSQDYSIVVTGIGTVASADQFADNIFSVYPNPAHDVLNITLKAGLASDSNVAVFDIQGRQVVAKKLSSASDSIDINHLSAGFYIVKLTQGNKQYVKKVMVK